MARMNVLADIAKGLKANIHAVDNLSPVARVAVYVRAGSRYEPDHLPGISHHIRAAAGLSTEDSSIFGITRHMERAGAAFKVTSDREYIIYRVDCLRDKLGYVMGFIDDSLHKPEFRPWELFDYLQPRLKEELGRYKKNQNLLINEVMHKAAFRGGLAHSIFTPEHQVDKIKKNDLLEYHEKNYVLDRMTFTGLGVDENELRSIVEERFRLNSSDFQGISGETRYVGGEARVQAGFPHTMVNFVVQGSSVNDMKSLAALEVISALIGKTESIPVKYGHGPGKTLTGLLNSISPFFKTSVVNINYADTGIFGFSMMGPNQHMKQATKHAVQHVRKLLANISEKDLKAAKRTAKGRLLLHSENQDAVFSVLGRRHAAGIVGQSPLDQIEKLTLKDVQSVAANLLKSKPTLVSVGNPRFVPYVDELEA